MLIAAFPEVKEIGMKVSKALGAKYTTILSDKFPDSEYHLILKRNPSHNKVVIISSMAIEPNNKLIETVLAGGIAKDFGAKEVILVATYMPYLRQDKHFIKFDSFSSSHIMKMFNIFDRVITIDPHLHRIKNLHSLSKKAESISAKMLVAEYIKKRFGKDFTLLGPDGESEQWDSPIAKALGTKAVVLTKHRSSGTKIRQNKLNEALSENVILVDDIISTGKTLAGALKIAKKQGAKNLVCIGIHGLLVNGADKLITKYAELITSNTISSKYSKIDVSPIIIESLRS
jgi:ribose-phosphate pyrophosphokinase